MGFVPSALGEPRGVISWCDNRCSEKKIRYLQIVSMVIEEGEEARTINLCQQCYNEKLVQQGKMPLTFWQWKRVVRRRRTVEGYGRCLGVNNFMSGLWVHFTRERAGARKVLADTAR